MFDNVFNFDAAFTPHIYTLFVIVGLVTIFCVIINIKIRKASPYKSTKGVVFLTELSVKKVNGFVEDTMGKKNMKFAPYILTLSVFLIISNLIGLFGLRSPTTNLNITLTLALITFFLIIYHNIKAKGIKGYIKGFMAPVFLFLPINLLGELATPVSMGMRLFGNILAGTILLTILYTIIGEFMPDVVASFITPAFHAYFDVFAGLIQTLIFVLLTSIFISLGQEKD